MLSLISLETTSRQLISNMSEQPIDLLPEYASKSSSVITEPIFYAALVVLGLALGFALGKRRIVSFILVLYLTAAVGVLVPLETMLPGGKTTEAYVLIGILLLLIILFVFPAHFSGNRFWFVKWIWSAIFGLLSVGLLVGLLMQFGPSAWLAWLPTTALKIFGNNIFKTTVTLLPLLFLWLAARKGEE